MTDTHRPPSNALLIFSALVAGAVYWLVVLTLAYLQFWVVFCDPSVSQCPTLFTMSARAIGVLAAGAVLFVGVVWAIRRFPALATYFVSAVLTGALVVGAWWTLLRFA